MRLVICPPETFRPLTSVLRMQTLISRTPLKSQWLRLLLSKVGRMGSPLPVQTESCSVLVMATVVLRMTGRFRLTLGPPLPPTALISKMWLSVAVSSSIFARSWTSSDRRESLIASPFTTVGPPLPLPPRTSVPPRALAMRVPT